MRLIGLQLARYLLGGSVALGVDVSVFVYLRTEAGLDLLAANVAARVSGAVTAYLINHYWTFRIQAPPGARSALRYAGLWLVSTLCSSTALQALHGWAGSAAAEAILKTGVELLLALINFIICKTWVYRTGRTEAASRLAVARITTRSH